jgi:hypothetical protein
MATKTKTTTRCGVEYPIGRDAPSAARWAVRYWGHVVYFARRTAADRYVRRLSWHDSHDVEITVVREQD